MRCITRDPIGPYVNSNFSLQIWAAVKQIWIRYVVLIIYPFTSKIENVRLGHEYVNGIFNVFS